MILTFTAPRGLRVTLDTATARWSARPGDDANGKLAAVLTAEPAEAPGPHDTPVTIGIRHLAAYGFQDIEVGITGEPEGAEEAGEDCFEGVEK